MGAGACAQTAAAHQALEAGERQGTRQKALIDDLPLFRAAPAVAPTPRVSTASAIEVRLRDLHPDEMTPLEALRALYELKQSLGA